MGVNYFVFFSHIHTLHVQNVFYYYFIAAEQAEIQKTIDELKTEVNKRDANIKQLQTSLKEAETILVYLTMIAWINIESKFTMTIKKTNVISPKPSFLLIFIF